MHVLCISKSLNDTNSFVNIDAVKIVDDAELLSPHFGFPNKNGKCTETECTEKLTYLRICVIIKLNGWLFNLVTNNVCTYVCIH